VDVQNMGKMDGLVPERPTSPDQAARITAAQDAVNSPERREKRRQPWADRNHHVMKPNLEQDSGQEKKSH